MEIVYMHKIAPKLHFDSHRHSQHLPVHRTYQYCILGIK